MITEQGLIGVQLAFDKVNRLMPDWEARAYEAFTQAAKQAKSPFTIEQIREQIAKMGIEPPTDQRVYGHIVLRAARLKLIKKTGEFAPARSSHGSAKPLWVCTC